MHLAVFPRRRAGERVGERGVPARPAHPAECDVGRKRPLVAPEAELGERRVHASGERGHLGCALRHASPDDPGPTGRRKGSEPADSRLEGMRVADRRAQRAGDRVDPLLGDGAEELEREVQIARGDPGDVVRRSAQPLDRLVERAPNGVVQKDGNERANAGYRRVSRSWIKLRMPSCRSGSGSITSAPRRSARAPSWSPCSSFSRPRAASARESSGAGAVGSDATSREGAALDGAASDAGGAGATGAVALSTLLRVGAGFSTDGVAGTPATADGAGAASAWAAVAGGAGGSGAVLSTLARVGAFSADGPADTGSAATGGAAVASAGGDVDSTTTAGGGPGVASAGAAVAGGADGGAGEAATAGGGAGAASTLGGGGGCAARCSVVP